MREKHLLIFFAVNWASIYILQIYWLGPILGALIGVLFYTIFTYVPNPKGPTADTDVQTQPIDSNTNGNVMVSSDEMNSSTSYDEILIQDGGNMRSK